MYVFPSTYPSICLSAYPLSVASPFSASMHKELRSENTAVETRISFWNLSIPQSPSAERNGFSAELKRYPDILTRLWAAMDRGAPLPSGGGCGGGCGRGRREVAVVVVVVTGSDSGDTMAVVEIG